MTTTRHRSPRGAMLLGAGAAVVSLLPLFLVGAMAVPITEELAFGSFGLGLTVAAFRGAGAVSSIHLGRLVDDLGATRSIRLACAIAATASLGIATTARGLASLLAWLALCGTAVALAQPAANRLLIAAVDSRRLGAAFGVKQSAPPGASMLAGFAVPVVALTVGWRWAYVLAAAIALVILVVTGRAPVRRHRRDANAGPRPPLSQRGLIILLAVAFGLGDSTNAIATTFYVDAAVAAGTPTSLAGTLLAVASVAAIATRLAAGLVSDRLRSGHIELCGGLLLFGSMGLLALASNRPDLMAAGAIIAFIGCWGFNGVFWFALVRAYADTPGRITGAVAPGGLLGSTVGPIIFGGLAEIGDYPFAFTTFAVIGVASAATMTLGGRRLARG